MRINAPYKNEGNELVLSMIAPSARRILDVGCGAGDNARRLKENHPDIAVVGLTHSAEEAELASPFMDAVHVLDLESDFANSFNCFGPPFDVAILSHVLEHLTDPIAVLRALMPILTPTGEFVIAVPNVLEWRTRTAFLRGDFRYADHGVLDRTHMRFFTYNSAPAELIAPIEELELVRRQGRGSMPLGPLRQLTVAQNLCVWLDRQAINHRPNLFAREVVMVARKVSAPYYRGTMQKS